MVAAGARQSCRRWERRTASKHRIMMHSSPYSTCTTTTIGANITIRCRIYTAGPRRVAARLASGAAAAAPRRGRGDDAARGAYRAARARARVERVSCAKPMRRILPA
eukprot:scaffold926_cov408-Prasinococcus_capsulatus_cf.AAC.23